MRILAYSVAALGSMFLFPLLIALSERNREQRPILAAVIFGIGAVAGGGLWQWATGSWIVFWAFLILSVMYGFHRARHAPIRPR